MAAAAEMTHDNHVYARGWRECLKYLQATGVTPPPRMPGGETARQTSITHLSNRDNQPEE